MSQNICLIAFCLLASVSCIYCLAPLAPFSKDGNAYVSVFGNIANDQSSIGYAETIAEVLIKFRKENASFHDLNKFNQGLDQLFLFKFLKKYYEDELLKLNEPSNPTSDFVTVPDFNDESGLVFKDLTVYSYPVYKKGPKPEPYHDTLRSSSEYKVTAHYNSDNVILTGSVYIDGSKYFFVYQLSSPIYSVEVQMKRNPEEVIFAKRSLAYQKENYINTYDSSYDNSTVINSILNETVVNKLLPYVFYELSKNNADDLKYQVIKKEQFFVGLYERVIFGGLLESALEYVKAYVQTNNNGNDTFAASEIVYKVDSSSAPLPFQQKTHNITLKGFLNYANKPEPVYENTSISDNGRLFNMSQGIKFNYPEDGDKHAVVSFVISSGRRDLIRELKLKSITIISEYLADLTKKQQQVYRNKDVFFNKAGILIRLETYGADPVYDFVLNHLGNDLARTIQDFIENGAAPAAA